MSDEHHYAACEITLQFGDGEYLFRLGLKQIAELQQKCGAGLGAVYSRVLAGRVEAERNVFIGLPTHAQWRWEDLRETIRLALEGGEGGVVNEEQVKLSPIKARQLVERYVDGVMTKAEAWDLATVILSACIEGYRPPPEEGDEAEKK